MEIIKNGTHGVYRVPTGAVINVYPSSTTSSARATSSKAGDGPWLTGASPLTIGPFAYFVDITVECLTGHAGIDVTAPAGTGSGSTTVAALTDRNSYDFTANTSVAAIKTTADTNTTNVTANTASIATHTSQIATNTTNIASNTTSLAGKAAVSQPLLTKSFFIPAPADGLVVSIPVEEAMTITKITAKTASGTATITAAISGTNLTGTAVSASSTKSSQTYAAANVAAAGQDFTLTASSSSSPVNLGITVVYTKTLA